MNLRSPELQPRWTLASWLKASVGAAALALGMLSCADTDGTNGAEFESQTAAFLDEPALQLETESGALMIELRSLPAPLPSRGTNRVELRVLTQNDGTPIDGLELQMIPFMPAMGHGNGTEPDVTPLGDGRYEFSNVQLTMPGRWELRTTISGAHSDYVAPSFNVQ